MKNGEQEVVVHPGFTRNRGRRGQQEMVVVQFSSQPLRPERNGAQSIHASRGIDANKK
jgi:hypothetical protein